MTDVGPAEQFVAGAVGEPGNRTFYLYITAGGQPTWLLIEKQQVTSLAEHSMALLAESNIHPSPDVVAIVLDRLDLPEPGEPRFRVGTVQLRASTNRELVAITVRSVDEDDEIEFQIAPEQLQAMAMKALEIVGQGRPICDLCRLPMDPDGHRCPASNGHHADG